MASLRRLTVDGATRLAATEGRILRESQDDFFAETRFGPGTVAGMAAASSMSEDVGGGFRLQRGDAAALLNEVIGAIRSKYIAADDARTHARAALARRAATLDDIQRADDLAVERIARGLAMKAHQQAEKGALSSAHVALKAEGAELPRRMLRLTAPGPPPAQTRQLGRAPPLPPQAAPGRGKDAVRQPKKKTQGKLPVGPPTLRLPDHCFFHKCRVILTEFGCASRALARTGLDCLIDPGHPEAADRHPDCKRGWVEDLLVGAAIAALQAAGAFGRACPLHDCVLGAVYDERGTWVAYCSSFEEAAFGRAAPGALCGDRRVAVGSTAGSAAGGPRAR